MVLVTTSFCAKISHR